MHALEYICTDMRKFELNGRYFGGRTSSDGKTPIWQVEVVRDMPTAKRVASILCNRAADVGAAALVLAQHKRSALAKMFVGSTVACAASTSTVPLLIVP